MARTTNEWRQAVKEGTGMDLDERMVALQYQRSRSLCVAFVIQLIGVGGFLQLSGIQPSAAAQAGIVLLLAVAALFWPPLPRLSSEPRDEYTEQLENERYHRVMTVLGSGIVACMSFPSSYATLAGAITRWALLAVPGIILLTVVSSWLLRRAARQQPKLFGISWIWMEAILTVAFVQYLDRLLGNAPGAVAWLLSILMPALLVMAQGKRDGALSGRGWLVLLSISIVVGAAAAATALAGISQV